jgi:hypothetical protein
MEFTRDAIYECSLALRLLVFGGRIALIIADLGSTNNALGYNLVRLSEVEATIDWG